MTLGVSLGDTDDAMRLVEVRALLDGRAWYDLIEPRLAPPEGLAVHWSRLVDGAQAALLALLRLAFGREGGETALRAAWPILLFAPAAWLTLHVTRALGGRSALWAGAALTASSGMLWLQFQPGRLDHHNVQLLLMAAMMACALDLARPRTGAIMGALAALSLAVGFEALPVLVWAGALVTLRFVLNRENAPAAVAFGLALAGVAASAFALQTPPSWWGRAACDAMGANALAGALAAGLGLAGAATFARASRAARLSSSALVAGAALAAFALLRPACLRGPYADLDPRLFSLWLDLVGEAQPLSAWIAASPVMALSGALLPLATVAAAIALITRGERSAHFIAVTALLALTALVGLIQVRGLVQASLAAVPLAAAMLGRLRLPVAITPLAGGLGLGLLASPMSAQLALNALASAPMRAREAAASFDQRSCFTFAALADLKTLAPGAVIADLDSGPHILAQTHLSVVGAPYHRIGEAIYETMTVFTGPPEAAAAIVRRAGADYVALCRTGVFAANSRPGSFGAALLAGHAPPWAAPIGAGGGTNGGYAVFEVRKDLLARHDGLKGRIES